MPVGFHRPHVVGAEIDTIAEAIENAKLSSNGPFSERCTRVLQQQLSAERVLLTNSGTSALEMAAILAGTEPGDEVVMPSWTFPSTANAFVLRGGVPVFVDVREDTLNIDESLVEGALTERTRAIVPVHYGGVACEMASICELASSRGITVVEDAAQGVAATWRGRPLGTIGELGVLSFHDTKNVTSGEGGALIVNDPALVERAEVIQEKGTNRSAFFRGETDFYSWQDIGSSFALSDLAAAFLSVQLDHVDEITAARLSIWERYQAAFAEFEAAGRVRRQVIPEGTKHNAHLYYLLARDGPDRDALIAGLAGEGVKAVAHWVPLHSSEAGLRFGRAATGMDVTDSIAARIVRLPLWVGMTDEDVETVIAAVADQLAG